MKTKMYYLALAVVAGVLCVPTLGEVESPRSLETDLIGRPNPTLADIEQVYVVIVRPHFRADEDGLLLKELEQSVRDKLEGAGITVAEDDVDKMKSDLTKVLQRRLKEQGQNVRDLKFRSVNTPELRIDIDTLKLADSQQFVFHIHTSVARAVCLSKQHRPIFKADVWNAEPTMQAVSVQSMPAVVGNKVLEQVDEFIHAYDAANQPGKPPSDAQISGVVPPTRAKSEQPANQAVAEYGYVASKNSEVFHKAGCRWAKRIAPKNLVRYRSRDEAIKAGKRPCKMCKP